MSWVPVCLCMWLCVNCRPVRVFPMNPVPLLCVCVHLCVNRPPVLTVLWVCAGVNVLTTYLFYESPCV